MANRYASLEARFWAKVQRTDGCWLWTGTHDGYGKIRQGGRQLLAHRVSYEINVGPIPSDLTIDHLCFNKLCVNPDHLEPVSRGENVRRWTRTIIACPAGHPYDETNTYVSPDGKRSCRACQRAIWHRSQARKRHALAALDALDAGGEES